MVEGVYITLNDCIIALMLRKLTFVIQYVFQFMWNTLWSYCTIILARMSTWDCMFSYHLLPSKPFDLKIVIKSTHTYDTSTIRIFLVYIAVSALYWASDAHHYWHVEIAWFLLLLMFCMVKHALKALAYEQVLCPLLADRKQVSVFSRVVVLLHGAWNMTASG